MASPHNLVSLELAALKLLEYITETSRHGGGALVNAHQTVMQCLSVRGKLIDGRWMQSDHISLGLDPPQFLGQGGVFSFQLVKPAMTALGGWSFSPRAMTYLSISPVSLSSAFSVVPRSEDISFCLSAHRA